MKCKGKKKNGEDCGMPATNGDFCRWHSKEEPSMFDGWSNHEIVVHVRNVTDGRVKLDERIPREWLEEQAKDALV